MDLASISQDITDLYRALRHPEHPAGAGDDKATDDWLAEMRNADADTVPLPLDARPNTGHARAIGRVDAARIPHRPPWAHRGTPMPAPATPCHLED